MLKIIIDTSFVVRSFNSDVESFGVVPVFSKDWRNIIASGLFDCVCPPGVVVLGRLGRVVRLRPPGFAKLFLGQRSFVLVGNWVWIISVTIFEGWWSIFVIVVVGPIRCYRILFRIWRGSGPFYKFLEGSRL